MANFRGVVCSACRSYGVPLLDTLCPVCYTLKVPPKTFRPVPLPKSMLDLQFIENKHRSDVRRTVKYKLEE